MTILIADDEYIVRLGLKSMIMQQHKKDCIIVEAKNGREMCSLCEKYQPDLAFVDIKMPEMDGITAVRHCRAQCPHTSFILLSGLSDFQIAVNALKLGVSDYLLKPITADDLSEILKNVKQNVDTRKQQQNIDFELRMTFQFNNVNLSDRGGEESSLALSEGETYCAYVILEDTNNQSQASSSLYHNLIPALQKHLRDFVEENYQHAIFSLNTGELCLVLRVPKQKTPNRIESILRNAIYSDPKPGHVYTVFRCCSNTGVEDLAWQIDKLRGAFNLRVLLGMKNLHTAKSLRALADSKTAEEFSNLVAELCMAFNDKDEISYKNLVDKLASLREHFDELQCYCGCVNQYISIQTGLKYNCENYSELITALNHRAGKMYAQSSVQPQHDMMAKIKTYIQTNYMSDVSIISIAEKFNITPNYLSRIFHQKTGVKLIDYVTDVRINNAKRILADNPNMLIKDVAMMVGYYSTRHFTKLFLKNTGSYPSEFSKQKTLAE